MSDYAVQPLTVDQKSMIENEEVASRARGFGRLYMELAHRADLDGDDVGSEQNRVAAATWFEMAERRERDMAISDAQAATAHDEADDAEIETDHDGDELDSDDDLDGETYVESDDYIEGDDYLEDGDDYWAGADYIEDGGDYLEDADGAASEQSEELAPWEQLVETYGVGVAISDARAALADAQNLAAQSQAGYNYVLGRISGNAAHREALERDWARGEQVRRALEARLAEAERAAERQRRLDDLVARQQRAMRQLCRTARSQDDFAWFRFAAQREWFAFHTEDDINAEVPGWWGDDRAETAEIAHHMHLETLLMNGIARRFDELAFMMSM